MSSALETEATAKLNDRVKAAQAELDQLNSFYAELAADAALTGASMLPPPAGTAADLASLAKSLATGDYVGALFDTIGFVPLIGDGIKAAGKGVKAVDRLNDLRKAIDEAAAALARTKDVLKRAEPDEIAEALERSGDLMEVRKAAAERYWDEIAEAGQKRYDDAIKQCSTQKCIDEAILLKGDQYQNTPVNGGKWREGTRGDGLWVPDGRKRSGRAVKEFNEKFPDVEPVKGIRYTNGRPDFSPMTVPIPGGKGRASVEIAQTGDDVTDFARANEALEAATGYTRKKLQTEHGMKLTWHHAPDGVTMQLVPRNAHGARYSVGHAGGASTVQREGY